jgi:hypothetical protein
VRSRWLHHKMDAAEPMEEIADACSNDQGLWRTSGEFVMSALPRKRTLLAAV